MIITLRQLEKMDACEPARDLFEKVFGEVANLSEVVKELHNRNLDEYEAWLLDQNCELTKELIKVGADIHANNDGALCLAAEYGHLEVVKFLLENGSDVHAENDEALRWAAHKGHLEVANFLKKEMEKKK
ncbi:MAG: ankyrin repeat domain-containing protein [Patescibacteria group bacterium]|nr:ankyrin repeat domain-containing protein [Patescibacteria group bacterium]